MSIFTIDALATSGKGVAGNSQNRRGSGNNYVRGPEFQRRGPESMTDYRRRMARTPGSGVTIRTKGRGTKPAVTPEGVSTTPFNPPYGRYTR